MPDTAHEAMRDLVRARAAAVKDVGTQEAPGRRLPAAAQPALPAQEELGRPLPQLAGDAELRAPGRPDRAAGAASRSVRLAEERSARIERAIGEFLPTWSLAPLVEALQALRGVDLVTAVTFAVEVGDIRRFESPRRLMGYLGLVPGERSTGETVRRGSITKMGNARVRHLLVESAWTYRHPPRVGKAKLPKLERVSPKVREIAWKAQSRLTARYRALTARGKKTTVTCTAIARELAAFMWAVAREARPA